MIKKQIKKTITATIIAIFISLLSRYKSIGLKKKTGAYGKSVEIKLNT